MGGFTHGEPYSTAEVHLSLPIPAALSAVCTQCKYITKGPKPYTPKFVQEVTQHFQQIRGTLIGHRALAFPGMRGYSYSLGSLVQRGKRSLPCCIRISRVGGRGG